MLGIATPWVLTLLTAASPASGEDQYLEQVKPIFEQRCYSCHGALKQESALRLDTAALMREGGSSGPAVKPGDAQASLLLERITAPDEADRMPPEGKPLSADEVAAIRHWIEQGAPSPEGEQPQEDPNEHWAFSAPSRPALPQTASPEWVLTPIDAFIAARHESRGIQPAPPAAREELLRRVYLDLIGLPPTGEQLQAFLADQSPRAYQRAVNRLLASPQYGERWGRHWMDIWRYSDWYGRRQVNDVRNSYPHIWRWRDWIIRSLNQDKGYDQMVVEMLAADEVDPENDQAIVALGFIVRNWFSLNYDQWMKDLVEHTGKAFLGVRLNCAHCHDHKYDPITQEEYFKFRAFFEPLELRHDRVPGGPALTKYERYEPGSGGSLEPIEAGIARVFDYDLDAETYMYKLGDARNRFDRPPVQPAAPAILGGDSLEVQPLELPPRAWYPGLKSFVQQEEIQQRQSEVEQAQAELEKAENPAETQVAQARLEDARAQLAAIKARVKADQVRFLGKDGDPQAAARAAAKAERTAAWTSAKLALATAEKQLADAQAKAGVDEEAQAELDQAEKQKAKAAERVEQAAKQLDSESTEYTRLGPTYPRESTGRRRALARWIANRQNPLTARVAVNHIWMRHFGRPLVESVFDFGRSGKRPSHPKLLDWLAVELMDSGWSMKHLHRLIVTSNTYRLQSRVPENRQDNLEIDGDNLTWWRFERRRIEAETIRDSVLATAGMLDETLGGHELDADKEAESRRRSLYFTVYPEAGGMMQFMKTFDGPNPSECYRRIESVVPQQALAMVNSELMQKASRQLAKKLVDQVPPAPGKPRARRRFIQTAYEHILSRSPSDPEMEKCLDFLDQQTALYDQADSSESSLRAGASLVRVLFNHNDFHTLR